MFWKVSASESLITTTLYQTDVTTSVRWTYGELKLERFVESIQWNASGYNLIWNENQKKLFHVWKPVFHPISFPRASSVSQMNNICAYGWSLSVQSAQKT